MRLVLTLCIALPLFGQLPVVPNVELQPLSAQVSRVIESLDMLGEPLPAKDAAALRQSRSVEEIQRLLDAYCLIGVNINPESRVKAQQGPAKPELVQQGWRSFLVKVHNEAGITPVLNADSRNAGIVPTRPEGTANLRWMDLQMYNKQPMTERPSVLGVE